MEQKKIAELSVEDFTFKSDTIADTAFEKYEKEMWVDQKGERYKAHLHYPTYDKIIINCETSRYLKYTEFVKSSLSGIYSKVTKKNGVSAVLVIFVIHQHQQNKL